MWKPRKNELLGELREAATKIKEQAEELHSLRTQLEQARTDHPAHLRKIEGLKEQLRVHDEVFNPRVNAVAEGISRSMLAYADKRAVAVSIAHCVCPDDAEGFIALSTEGNELWL